MLLDARREFHSESPSMGAAADFHGFVPAFQDVFAVAAALCAVAWILSLFRVQKSWAKKRGQATFQQVPRVRSPGSD